jgi:hypothetical protein
LEAVYEFTMNDWGIIRPSLPSKHLDYS